MIHYICAFSYFALSQVDDSPTTREEVQEWFNDLIELNPQYSVLSWNSVLDCAEIFFHCDFCMDMSGENKNIHDWLRKLYLKYESPCPPT